MKIHTTQNLNSLAQNRNIMSTNQSGEIRLNYSEQMRKMRNSVPDTYESGVSFRGKKEIVTKAVEAGKKTFAEKVANNKVVKKSINSGLFNKATEITSKQEVMVQSGSALGICLILRPGTLLLFPGDKNKKDCKYAAVHSMSSGIWGFVVPFTLIKPTVTGYNKIIKDMHKYVNKYISESMIKRRNPHLDMSSIKNADGTIKDMKEWVDREGRVFVTDFKNVRKIAQPKHISEVSEDTMKKYFNDLDTSSIKNGANNLVTKDGKKAHIDLKDIYIALKDKESGKVKYYPLEHAEENILKDAFPDLDLNSVGGKGLDRLHPDKWLTKDGKAFNFDNNSIFISDMAEAEDMIPLITGRVREEVKGKKVKIKDVCYQNNSKDGVHDLGTAIERDMVEAGWANTLQDKIGSWLPEVITAYPRAAATIAILPFLLKHVFHIEKTKKPKQEVLAAAKEIKMDSVPSGKEVA